MDLRKIERIHMPALTLSVAGPVRLTGPNGTNLTPRPMKARGILAVMAVSKGLQVLRPRLQDLLWSDRGTEQGMASLRQSLREIRVAMGNAREALISGPGWVGLDPALVSVDLSPGDTPDMEFAADLDIRDPEFEDWLRAMRAHFAAQWSGQPEAADASALPELVLEEPVSADTSAKVVATMLLHESAARAGDLLPLRIVMITGGAAKAGGGMHLSLSAMAHAEQGQTVVLVILRDAQTGRSLFTRQIMIDTAQATQSIRAACGPIAVAILGAVESVGAKVAAHLPVRDVFSYSPDRLMAADRALAKFEGISDTAVLWAMRAYVRNTMVLERLAEDPSQAIAEAQDFSSRALAQDPSNPTVLAVAALSATRRRDYDFAHQLARNAVQQDGSNALARLALSQALSDLGQHDAAEVEAQRANTGAMVGLGPATWLMRLAITALRNGRREQAESHLVAASGFAPDYRPPLRFLAALRYDRGDEAGAAQALEKLRRIERDFTLDMMDSPTYPVATLRDIGLLGLTRSPVLRQRF